VYQAGIPAVSLPCGEVEVPTATDELELRVMKAIDAGTQAGGQPDGQRSAARFYENAGYGIMTLRLDDHMEPM
jgi:uncharacterized Ntn-hydrolase superfamily protein